MKKLYRSVRYRKLAGVCGGIAEYFDTDPTFIRLAWGFFAFCGIGIPMYILAAIVIPSRVL